MDQGFTDIIELGVQLEVLTLMQEVVLKGGDRYEKLPFLRDTCLSILQRQVEGGEYRNALANTYLFWNLFGIRAKLEALVPASDDVFQRIDELRTELLGEDDMSISLQILGGQYAEKARLWLESLSRSRRQEGNKKSLAIR
jgi:hypothetical protein